MATIADYLTELNNQKNALADNLNAMGVAADQSEKLNTLVPKVLECKTEQNVEFAEGADFTGTSTSVPGILKAISKVIIPDGTTEIGSYAFYNCSSLESITIPDSVTSLGYNAFYNTALTNNQTGVQYADAWVAACDTNVTSAEIKDGTRGTAFNAFYNCTSLKNITIPNSVTSIGSATFYNCTSLAHIYYTGTQTQWNNITKGRNWNYMMGSNVSGGTTIHYNYVPE